VIHSKCVRPNITTTASTRERKKGNGGNRKPSVGAGVADPEEAPVLGSFAGAMGSVVLPVAGSAPSLDRD
jgi:hypothetical protein